MNIEMNLYLYPQETEAEHSTKRLRGSEKAERKVKLDYVPKQSLSITSLSQIPRLDYSDESGKDFSRKTYYYLPSPLCLHPCTGLHSGL